MSQNGYHKLSRLHPATPDLDTINRQALREIIDRWDPHNQLQLGLMLYPDRPIGFVQAARILRAIAHQKLDTGKVPEDLYRRLPVIAQWRRRFNIAASVVEGKKLKGGIR